MRKSSPVRGLFWNITCPVPRSRASMLATAGLVRVSLVQVSAARRGAVAAAMTPLASIDGSAAWGGAPGRYGAASDPAPLEPPADAESSRARADPVGCCLAGRPEPVGPLRAARPVVGYDVTAHCPRSASLGPSAVGRMSKSKIAVGTYSEQQALGMSTMPLMRPSIGAEPSSR